MQQVDIMALIICKECGKQYSDKAAACPNCACPTEFSVGLKEMATTEFEQEAVTTGCANPVEKNDAMALEGSSEGGNRIDAEKNDVPTQVSEELIQKKGTPAISKSAIISLCVLGLFLLVLFVPWVSGGEDDSEKEREERQKAQQLTQQEQKRQQNEYNNVIGAAKSEVLRILLAPATASFPDVKILETDSYGRNLVLVTCDAQNRLGTYLRETYIVCVWNCTNTQYSHGWASPQKTSSNYEADINRTKELVKGLSNWDEPLDGNKSTPTPTPTPSPIPTKAPTSTLTPSPIPTKAPTSTPTPSPIPTKTPTSTPIIDDSADDAAMLINCMKKAEEIHQEYNLSEPAWFIIGYSSYEGGSNTLSLDLYRNQEDWFNDKNHGGEALVAWKRKTGNTKLKNTYVNSNSGSRHGDINGQVNENNELEWYIDLTDGENCLEELVRSNPQLESMFSRIITVHDW